MEYQYPYNRDESAPPPPPPADAEPKTALQESSTAPTETGRTDGAAGTDSNSNSSPDSSAGTDPAVGTAGTADSSAGTDPAAGTADIPRPLGGLGITLLVLGNLLYLLTAFPAYIIFILATQLLEESQLDALSFWMSFGWLISFAAGWGAFAWLYRTGAARSGAAVFLGIFFFWAGTSLLALFGGQ